MNQPSVFRSTKAANWIDMDLIDVQVDASPASLPAETQGSVPHAWQARPLRYRPFERLAWRATDQREAEPAYANGADSLRD